MAKPYRITKDNFDQAADVEDVIGMAKAYGYKGTGGMFFTSEAAQVLRDNGFDVTTNQNFAG